GKRHLRKLLKAIQRGCLDGSTSIEQKVNSRDPRHKLSRGVMRSPVVEAVGYWLIEGSHQTETLTPSSVKDEHRPTLEGDILL
ncbi:unnamed protein product, partial [Ectocarpus fasciculatus]